MTAESARKEENDDQKDIENPKTRPRPSRRGATIRCGNYYDHLRFASVKRG